MASAPKLAYVFGTYLGTTPNVATLRNTSMQAAKRPFDTIFVNGAITAGDGNGGVYCWIPNSLEDDDGQQTIKPFDVADTAPGRWKWSVSGNTELPIRVTTLESNYNDPTYGPLALRAQIIDETTARISGDQVTVDHLTSLEATVTSNKQETDALVSDESTARANAVEAVASRTSILEATVSDPNTGLAKAQARITDESTARATADTALSTRTSTLEAAVNDPNTGLAKANAKISDESTARANADGALASQTATLTAQFAGTAGSNILSQIQTESTARSNADSALASRTSTLEAQFAGTAGSNILAQIQNESTARANADTALSQQISQVSAQTDPGLGARVTTVENAVSSLNGKTAAYFQVTSVAGNNRAQLSVYADANSGAGVDLVGDVHISGNTTIDGNVIVGGSVTTNAITAGAITGYNQAYNSQTFTGAGTGNIYSIISYNVHMDYAGDILLWASCGQSYTSTSGSRPWHLDIYVNGGDYGGCGGATATSDSTACSGRVSVGPGDYTVELRWFGASVMSIPAGAASLITMRAYK